MKPIRVTLSEAKGLIGDEILRSAKDDKRRRIR
jgi:hypothetical protein